MFQISRYSSVLFPSICQHVQIEINGQPNKGWSVQRHNSLTKSIQKSSEFSSLLFKVTSTALPWDSYFFKLTQPLTVSRVHLLYTVKEKVGKPDRKQHPLTLWFKKSIQKPHVWELSRLCPGTATKLYVYEFHFWREPGSGNRKPIFRSTRQTLQNFKPCWEYFFLDDYVVNKD